MKINGIQCLKCKDVIFSRARHDIHWCSCKSVAIDGGFDYCKAVGDKFIMITIEAKVDKQELYNDWSSKKDKWGTHKPTDKKIKLISTEPNPKWVDEKPVVAMKKIKEDRKELIKKAESIRAKIEGELKDLDLILLELEKPI